MRVLITTDVIGGVWTFTQELSAGLLESGCDVVLVSIGGSPAFRHERWVIEMKESWGSSFRFTALTTKLEWMQENQGAFDEAAEDILHVAADFKADVLHVNQFCFGALRTSLPKVVTAHSDVLSWAKYCREELLEDSRWLRQYWALVSSGLAQADVVTAPTQWMLTEVAENFALPDESFVIPNGRSISMAAEGDRELQGITAGRVWDVAKNVAILREVSSPIPLLVAGETSFGQESGLSATNSVFFLGVLDEQSLIDFLSRSALYVCTSLYEPFGLAPLEAALCGCAVLANDIPSLREVWEDGALYFSGAASLSALLYSLAGNEGALSAAQARSRKRAKLYTRERMTASYLQVFSLAVTRGKRNLVTHAA